MAINIYMSSDRIQSRTLVLSLEYLECIPSKVVHFFSYALKYYYLFSLVAPRLLFIYL